MSNINEIDPDAEAGEGDAADSLNDETFGDGIPTSTNTTHSPHTRTPYADFVLTSLLTNRPPVVVLCDY